MNKFLKISAPMVAVALAGLNANAVPITGSVNFEGGTITYTTTAITSFDGNTVVSGDAGTLPMGSYAGTQGTAATFIAGGFSFSPLNPPVSVWSFIFGGNTYAFSLSAITYDSVGNGFLNVSGTGTLSISGGLYDATPGTFMITSTGVGPSTFGFTAGDAATATTPDGGTTLSLLGSALIGLGLLKRKFMA
jgi:hypothetical protein